MLALVLGGLCCSLVVALLATRHTLRLTRWQLAAARRERDEALARERDWRDSEPPVLLPFKMKGQPDLRTYSECDDEDRDAVHGWTKHTPREGGR